ncbi:MAG: type II CRISPR RNA-guided endonuclease Cas9 [Candidatus Nomurabacteria bacterium]|jgi:CRISPR-associated endonuclease Csn1|nr:type II CRISPR RNA-guided endonuclease Cas9 [Candidatus Nomurabacteria bacterium]
MKYSLGLDIGTTSVGWAVVNLEKKRIEDLGVRIFERPEIPKTGESLAKPRREARSARRRLKRRRQRLNYLKRFFIEHKFLTTNEIEKILSTPHNPYELRERGLKEKLTNEELFIALYHIAKRRGYKSNRKAVEEKDAEGGRVLKAINANKPLLDKYKTVAVALNEDAKFTAHKRNKADDYSNSFIRANFEDEIRAILEAQKWTSDEIEELLMKPSRGLFYQRPFMTPELIKKMQGKCQYEKGEPRAAKATYTFEMFRLAQDLSHLQITIGKEKRGLTEEEITKCVEKCKNTGKVTYKAIREALGYKNNDDFSFDYIRGKDPKQDESAKDKFAKEKNTFAELKFYHAVKKALTDDDWRRVENETKDIYDENPDKEILFDKIGEILTFNKDDEAIEPELEELELSDESIQNLLKLSFSGFGHLSIKALRKITPHLLKGETYDKAVEAEYPGEFKAKLSGDKNKLPPLSAEESAQITNPVVKRAIAQTIKVVNAIIRKYGAPTRIHVESASDLAKNAQDRKAIEKLQKENSDLNDQIVEQLKSDFNIASPTGHQINKMKFYREQGGKCPYCGKSIDIMRLFSDDHYGEIDHIIPFSRCGNDGRNNKVLVHNECNQNKRNQTPFETWGDDVARWTKFEVLVNSMNIDWRKKKRLLAKTPPKEDWNARALNDTRYVEKFIAGYFRKNLKFADDSSRKQKVYTPTGAITSYLRRVWGVGGKDRDENNLHHAADAVVIALADQGVIASVSRLNTYYELFDKNGADTVTDRITGEVFERKDLEHGREDILPWSEFGKDVRLRLSQPKLNENLEIWRDQFRDLYKNQDDEFRAKIHPIFVSRMPKRGGTGTTNKETLRSPKTKDGNLRTTRKRLSEITLKDLDNSILPESDKVLYEQLKELLAENGDDPKKAFTEKYVDADGKEKTRPRKVYKNGKSVDKNGRPISPVSTIKVYSNETSGFLINGGRAFVNNGDTIRLDIYKHDKGIFAAPVYAHLLHAGEIPILPTPNGRSRDEKTFWDNLKNNDGKIYATEDNGFVKLFGIYPNDYVRIKTKSGEAKEGYYVKYGISGGVINLATHTQTSKGDLDLTHISVGTIEKIEKLDISVLGDNYDWSKYGVASSRD